MKKLTLTTLLLSIGLYANTSIHSLDMDTCIDTSKHSNKSFKEMKELIVSKIQDEAFSKFYKDKTSNDFKGKLSKVHREELFVDVKDMYDNGTKFCNKATVSIKEEKLNYFLPQKVSLDRICHKDENLSPAKLKEKAEAKAYKELVSQVSKENITEDEAKSLVKNYEKKDGKMYMSKGAYCLSASGSVVPFEIDSYVSKKLDNIKNKNSNILKNKMSMMIENRKKSYKEKLLIDYTNNGIQISKKEFNLINKALNNDTVFINFSTKLLLPDEVKENIVSLSINGDFKFVGSGWNYRYFTFVNGKKITSKTQNVKVIKDNGQKYINLDINAYINQSSINGLINHIIPKLNSLIFDINSNSKIIPVIIKSNLSLPIIIKHKSTNKIKEFNVVYNKEIFNFNKEQLFYISDVLNNESLEFEFDTKLLIPSDIKSEVINFSISEPYYSGGSNSFRYYTYINGEQIRNKNQTIKVFNDNGLKYINLKIKSYVGKSKFAAFREHIIRRLNILNFMVSSNSNEKWYNLVPYVEKIKDENGVSYILNETSDIY